MKYAVASLVLAFSFAAMAADRAMPPASVPGVIDPTVTQENLAQTVCKPNYSASVRPPDSYTDKIKINLMTALKLPGKKGDFELDHRLEIAGSGAPRDPHNLWMQPMAEARLKDRLESFEHRNLCQGKITLKQVQAIFLGDFWKEYDRLAPQQGWPVWTGK